MRVKANTFVIYIICFTLHIKRLSQYCRKGQKACWGCHRISNRSILEGQILGHCPLIPYAVITDQAKGEIFSGC